MKVVSKFETLRVLHIIWKKRQMSTSQVNHILKAVHFMKLTKLEINKIEAISLDGKIKYSIK